MTAKHWMMASFALLLLVLLAIGAWWAFAPFRNLDILIVNGTVVDGTGSAPRQCDVAIRDGKIIGLGTWRFFFAKPKVTLDANHRIVAPGFIDVHTHVEPNLPTSAAFAPANFLRQGVTTLITGNCGRSRTDIAGLFRGLERHGTYINVATLIGHNSVRKEVMGEAAHSPNPDELNRMRGMIEQAMKDGALGLSTGLVYVPGRFAKRPEVIALAKSASDYGGIYASHIRDEARGGISAIEEALDIGQTAGMPTQISHFKCSSPSQWHTALQRLQLVEAAQAKGQRVNIDAYPYDCSSTTTDVLLPDWALQDNRRGLHEAARNAGKRQQLHDDIFIRLRQEGWPDLRHIRLVAGKPEWIGKTLADVPQSAHDLDHQIDNLIEVSLRGGAQAIYADMNEGDVEQIVTAPFGVFGSDSAVRDVEGQYKPHPRGCGTFPRIFRIYVREKQLLSLSAAVRKTSREAAEIFGLENRGLLRAGAWADVVIFDLATIEDRADYEQPFAEPSGIDYVLVNGAIVVDHGNLTLSKPAPGQALRKKPSALPEALSSLSNR
ncbi:MAG: amidohydrolase family protein [Acidobacteria bacterium]|nr:amidohydrolase family protein [Acidobacteriota bacterium]